MEGWKFPFAISADHGRVETDNGRENIQESVKIILLTEPGERRMHPDFGTKLHQFLFESMDSQTEELIRREVLYALQMWEKRICNINVGVEWGIKEQGVLHLTVSYRIAGLAEEDRVEIALGEQT